MRSASARYRVFISRVGENDLISQVFVSNQPYLGSLYKSQNGSVWEPSQWEDLKFTLYRADFVESGSIEVYSPELSRGNNQIAKLLPNSISLSSRSVRIGIGSTLQDTDLTLGNTIVQHGSNASGDFVGKAGIATGELNIINAGIGFTPSSGYLEYTGVELVNITSNGRNAKADITIDNGIAVGATISEYVASSGGQGYVVGDVLGVSTIGNNNLGRNLRLSLVSIANTNELLLDNVQGDFVTGVGNTLQFFNNSGIRTNLNDAQGGNVLIDGINEVVTDGVHFTVNHKNHGMYFDDNRVRLSDVQSDILPVKLDCCIVCFFYCTNYCRVQQQDLIPLKMLVLAQLILVILRLAKKLFLMSLYLEQLLLSLKEVLITPLLKNIFQELKYLNMSWVGYL